MTDSEALTPTTTETTTPPRGHDERTPSVSNNETEAALLAEGDLVADYFEELLDIADLDGDIENSVQDGRAFVAIDTDSDKLVGKDGEVLDALRAGR